MQAQLPSGCMKTFFCTYQKCDTVCVLPPASRKYIDITVFKTKMSYNHHRPHNSKHTRNYYGILLWWEWEEGEYIFILLLEKQGFSNTLCRSVKIQDFTTFSTYVSAIFKYLCDIASQMTYIEKHTVSVAQMCKNETFRWTQKEFRLQLELCQKCRMTS
jgi:hypothetical protein